MLPIFAVIIVILKIVISFSILILIHEFGHFIVAKKSGVWVEEFGLGLPPRIFGKKIGDTIYSLNALPIGGFVKLHGETSSDEVLYKDRAFTQKGKLTRIAITFAGVFMNFLLAVFLFGAITFVTGLPGKNDLVVTNTSPNSPAKISGVIKGDIVQKINGSEITGSDNFKSVIEANKGKKIALEVKRDKEFKVIELTPRLYPPAGEGSLGVEFTVVQETYFPPLLQRPFVSAWYGLKQTVEVAKSILFGLGGIAQNVSQGKEVKGVSGFVAIIAVLKRFSEMGMLAFVGFVAFISVNLAIINLIPFPPLDGARIALVIVEWVTKKKMSAKLEEKVYFVGFAVLIGLMILITSHEVPALFKAGSLDNYANQLLNIEK